MILYLDTSSLVKLYVRETHSDTVRAWFNDAEVVATCRIAYPETVSALNRRMRNGGISKKEYDILMRAFAKDWPDFARVDFDEMDAARLVEKYGLRGFDAVHLSSAILLLKDAENIQMAFSSFDEKLNIAAAHEGLAVLEAG